MKTASLAPALLLPALPAAEAATAEITLRDAAGAALEYGYVADTPWSAKSDRAGIARVEKLATLAIPLKAFAASPPPS